MSTSDLDTVRDVARAVIVRHQRRDIEAGFRNRPTMPRSQLSPLISHLLEAADAGWIEFTAAARTLSDEEKGIGR